MLGIAAVWLHIPRAYTIRCEFSVTTASKGMVHLYTYYRHSNHETVYGVSIRGIVQILMQFIGKTYRSVQRNGNGARMENKEVILDEDEKWWDLLELFVLWCSPLRIFLSSVKIDYLINPPRKQIELKNDTFLRSSLILIWDPIFNGRVPHRVPKDLPLPLKNIFFHQLQSLFS